MNTIGMNGGFGFSILWIVHILAVIAFAAGLVFLLAWAIKTFPITKLFQWAAWLLVGGAIACLLTMVAIGGPWTGGYSKGSSCSMMKDGKCAMMDSMKGMNGGMAGMDHGSDMDMSMSGMMDALDGKTGDEFDEAFVRMMIPHHQGAIDMAEAAKTSAKHQEIKDMADDIISAQQREIDMMKGWLTTWGYEN